MPQINKRGSSTIQQQHAGLLNSFKSGYSKEKGHSYTDRSSKKRAKVYSKKGVIHIPDKAEKGPFGPHIRTIPFIGTFSTLLLVWLTRVSQNYSVLREKSLAIYFEDSQFRRNWTFNIILSNIYVDKRSRIRCH